MQQAIEHALNVLGWYENLPKDEVPPEHLWEDTEGLELWWKRVERKREDESGASRGSSSDTDEHDGDDQTPGMTENEYARYLKQG